MSLHPPHVCEGGEGQRLREDTTVCPSGNQIVYQIVLEHVAVEGEPLAAHGQASSLSVSKFQ